MGFYELRKRGETKRVRVKAVAGGEACGGACDIEDSFFFGEIWGNEDNCEEERETPLFRFYLYFFFCVWET